MPFVKTALISGAGAARSQGSGGENINHFAGVRMRVIGSGNLQMTLFSQDSVRSQTLTSFVMASTARISPFRLTSFVEQRAQLRIETTAINEIFRINRIVLYVKPIFTMEPG